MGRADSVTAGLGIAVGDDESVAKRPAAQPRTADVVIGHPQTFFNRAVPRRRAGQKGRPR